jgi:EAL domain-containing protein (putative c-di-GMP-specific phosphodiesterase class I)
MCFWFGLRLVYKKKFNVERFLTFLTFYPLKKVASPLIRVEKKFFKRICEGYQKKQNFAMISKMCSSLGLLSLAEGIKIFTETDFLRTSVFFRISRPTKIT